MDPQRYLQIFARIVSICLHPFLMPFYLLILVFNTQSIFALMPPSAKWYCFLVTVITLFLIPLLSLPILRHFHLIRSFSLEEGMERIWLLLVMVISTFFGFWLLTKISYTDVIQRLYLIIIILQSSSISIISKWKISLHMVGAGAMCGVLFILGYKYLGNTQNWLMLGFLFAGLLASCRLYSEKNSPVQVYVGYILGNVCTTLLF